jgi:hypothetical protein
MKTIPTIFNRFVHVRTAAFAAMAVTALLSTPALAIDNDNDGDDFKFDLIRSQGLDPKVLPNAHGRVEIESLGPVEIMKVKVWGLPPNTDFDLFVIQAPNKPFGLSWYQGDIETNKYGVGYGEFVGRFSIETFIVAPGMAPVPDDPFHDPHRIPDAIQNPITQPIQTYHLGLWFNSPQDAQKAGAPNAVTPFNGEHNAGVQILNSGEFPDKEGPLKNVTKSGN